MIQPLTEERERRDIVGKASVVELVVPVFNEEQALDTSIRTLRTYLDNHFPFSCTITIVDNASMDATFAIACRLANELEGVHVLHLDEKGRGRALSKAWRLSRSEIVAYTDVDLSTDLDALLPLIAPIISGHSDMAIGTRLARSSKVVRGAKRELISRTYNFILHIVMRAEFSDAQCGFKAIRRDAALELLPLVVDTNWFFDTELLLLAQRNGFRIHEIPVDWVDDPDSTVDLRRTAIEDLRGVFRVARTFAQGGGTVRNLTSERRKYDYALKWQIGSFASIGTLSTISYLLIFIAIRGAFGDYLANAFSLGLCTALNTFANRRYTFGPMNAGSRSRELLGAVIVLTTSLVLSSIAILAARTLTGGSLLLLIVAILSSNLLAGCIRFVVLKSFIYRAGLRHQHQYRKQQHAMVNKP